MVAYGPQMAHAQAERLNQSGRCRNPTAGAAPWLARDRGYTALYESTEKYRQSQKNKFSQPD